MANTHQIDDRQIQSTIRTLLHTFVDETIHNIYANGSYIAETFMLAKKFVLLTNFLSNNVSKMTVVQDSSEGAFLR